VAGRSISTMGTWIHLVAAGWLVYHLTGSATSVGVVALLARGPSALLSVWGAALANRFTPRRATIATSIALALPAFWLAAAAFDHDVRVWEIQVAMLLLGLVGALASAPLSMVAVDAAPEDLQRQAVTVSSSLFGVARLLGSALGGFILEFAGAGWCFALNGASSVVLVLLVLRYARNPEAAKPERGHGALAILRQRPGILLAPARVLPFALLMMPLQELAPVVARRHDEGAHAVGLILAAFALGSIVGGPLLRRALPRIGAPSLLGAGTVLGAAGLVVVALSGHLAVSMLGIAAVGMAWEFAFVVVMSDAQLLTDDVRATSVGLVFALLSLGISVGAVASGALVDAVGLVTTFGVAAALLLASSAYPFLARRGRPAPIT
jgi:predicted MFS family arabinose efflux permease